MTERVFVVKFTGQETDLAGIGELELTEDLCSEECPLHFASVEAIEVTPDAVQVSRPGTTAAKEQVARQPSNQGNLGEQ
jgi:hypothetical protein